jgi:hypothetical protein
MERRPLSKRKWKKKKTGALGLLPDVVSPVCLEDEL